MKSKKLPSLSDLQSASLFAVREVRAFVRRRLWQKDSCAENEAVVSEMGKEKSNPCRRIDLDAEKLLLAKLDEALATSFAFIAEENGCRKGENDNLLAVIDALDGSDLTIRRRDLFGAVSLAWVDLEDGSPLLAVVADLVSHADTIWFWRKGKGSFLSHRYQPDFQPLRLSLEVRADPFLCAGLIKPFREEENREKYASIIARVVEEYPSARFSKVHAGSPGICRAAMGAIDAVVSLAGAKVYDLFGPALILQGSGGTILDPFSGERLKIEIDPNQSLESQAESRYPFVAGHPFWAAKVRNYLNLNSTPTQ